MVTDIIMEEARLLHSTNDDFFYRGETNTKCPRCGGKIVLIKDGSSYTIACSNGCISIDYRGL